MTQNQIAYQNLKEGIRHNLATESISSTSNAINREHYMRADQAALSQAESAARNASTSAYNASINYMNALTNQRQADASMQNAASNRMNAISNQRQADAAVQNAATNWRNAATNARNADINLLNAATQAKNAETQATKVKIEGYIAPSTVAANYGKAEQSKASAFKSTVDSYGEHPVVATLVASGATNQIAKTGTAVVGGVRDFFTSTGDPSPVTIGVGFVNRVAAKSTVKKGGGGARHSSNGKSRKVGPRVVHN